jgi:hypothetical protein
MQNQVYNKIAPDHQMIKLAPLIFAFIFWKEIFGKPTTLKVAIGLEFDDQTQLTCISSSKPSVISLIPDEYSNYEIPPSINFLNGEIFFGRRAENTKVKPNSHYYSLTKLVFEEKNPWKSTVTIKNGSSKDLFSVLSLYFGYLKSIVDDFLAGEYGIQSGFDTLSISVRTILYVRCPQY